MDRHFIGIMTCIGFLVAAWSYPYIKPVLDNVLNPEYTCKIEYMLPNGFYQERITDASMTELKVGKFIKGFRIVDAHFVGDKFFGVGYHPEYKVEQLSCTKKEK